MVGLPGRDAMPGVSRLHDPGTCATAIGMRGTCASHGRARRTGPGTVPICALVVKLLIIATRLTVIARCESELDVTLVALRGTGKMDAWTQAGCLTEPANNAHGRERLVEGPDTTMHETTAGIGRASASEVTGAIGPREEGDGTSHRASQCLELWVGICETAEMHAMMSPFATILITTPFLVPPVPVPAVRPSGVRTLGRMDGGTAGWSLDAHRGHPLEATLPSHGPHLRVRSGVLVIWTPVTIPGTQRMFWVEAVAEGWGSEVLGGVLCERPLPVGTGLLATLIGRNG
jgi:hypothetical protein